MELFLNEIRRKINNGYFYYSISRIPEKKRAKCAQIDKKLIAHYGIEPSHYKYYQNRKAEIANYQYFRYDTIVIILKSDGESTIKERFIDIRQTPLGINVAPDKIVKIKYGDKILSIKPEKLEMPSDIAPDKIDISNNYLCNSWQAFIQQIVHNISHGYRFYSYSVIPAKRLFNAQGIDYRLISTFGATIQRSKRYHNKKSGNNKLYLFAVC